MKKLPLILFGLFLSLISCKKEEPEGGMPLGYTHFFQILGPEGGDPFKDWTEEELEGIRYKAISVIKDETAESPWNPLTVIQNDTATIFVYAPLPDTTFIQYPNTDYMDTIVHQRKMVYDKFGNLRRILVSKFYFNGDLEEELDFESDPELLRRLNKTNYMSLTEETYVMRFTREK